MHVLKFGGTSVGSIASIKNVTQVVEARTEPVIVVVSALGGITDHLIGAAEKAAAGDESYLEEFRFIGQRHYDVAEGLLDGEALTAIKLFIKSALDELADFYRGIYLIGELSPKTLCAVVSYGERISSRIVAAVIKGARHVDSLGIIRTQKMWDKNVCDFGQTTPRIVEALGAFARCEQGKVVVMGGFISTDSTTGEITNLGRGGSDYTAAIVAAALDAEMLEIWTDVDGFMTADPRVIDGAYVIGKLSFVEAMELCNFGAKVIYPPTIFPVYHKNIPIIIKNTFNPEAPGTYISQETTHGDGRIIKGISSINDTSLVTVSGLGMVGVIGINKRIFTALANNGISVFIVSQASSESSSTIGVKNADAERAVEVLKGEFAKEISMGEITSISAEHDLATVAIVGEKMKSTPGIAGKLFRTLGQSGINVIACAQGASETNISFVTYRSNLRKALGVIHDAFFLGDVGVLNIFLTGVGLVGRNLLDQIKGQHAYLKKHKNLELRVVGLSNSRHCVFDREGIDLATWEERLAASTDPSSPEILRDRIVEMNIFNAVFVDCTASPQIAAIYQSLIEHNVNVVCANKIAASGDFDAYRLMKRTARKRGVKYLFETNVGAGLPLISTINNLINSGDEILKIEAVVSGTLNYIFNVLSADVPMSRAIQMAREAGYAEPDPRMDLNGSDVVRKIVILSRESGYHISKEDVETHLFFPEEYFTLSIDDFWRRLPELDDHFEAMRREAESQHKVFRFVATLEGGKARVELRKVGPSHPFYHLEGSNNVILLTTRRYNANPMEIKGYGAGAAVTAAGVFGDIIGIANIR